MHSMEAYVKMKDYLEGHYCYSLEDGELVVSAASLLMFWKPFEVAG